MADCVERDPAGALCSSFIRNEAPSNAVEGGCIREVIAAAPTEQKGGFNCNDYRAPRATRPAAHDSSAPITRFESRHNREGRS